MIEIKDILKKILEGEIEVINKEIKSQKFSSVIYLPKKYKGKKAIIIIKDENQTRDFEGRE